MSAGETYALLAVGVAGLGLTILGTALRSRPVAYAGGACCVAYVGLLYAAVRLLQLQGGAL